MGYSIQITSRDGEPLSALGEASGEYAFEGMSFESVCNGGFTVATFTVHRDARDYWKDLIFGNPVKIVRGVSRGYRPWERRSPPGSILLTLHTVKGAPQRRCNISVLPMARSCRKGRQR